MEQETKKKYEFYSVELETWGAHERNDGGFRLHYAANIGVGTVTFFKKDGEIMVDNEYMSKEFVEQVLAYFNANAIVHN